MRDIKFRVWDKLNGEMVYSDEKQSDYGFDLDNGVVRCYVERATVDACGDEYIDYDYLDNIMQYIGLKDSDSKEIYEGDIVKIEDYYGEDIIGKIIYDETWACYCFMQGDEKRHFKTSLDLEGYVITVIGNI